MSEWFWFGGSLIGVGLVIVLLRRKLEESEEYFEREYKDPPMTDIGDRIGGGGF